MQNKWFKILLVLIVAFLSARLFLLAVEVASHVSEHPITSLLMRLAFLAMLAVLVLLRKKENLVIVFILSFPFFRIAFNGISLFTILSLVLFMVYFREICAYFKSNADIYKIPFIILGACIVYTSFIAYDKNSAIDKALFFLNLYIAYLVLTVFFLNMKNMGTFLITLNVVAVFGVLVSFLQSVFGVGAIKLFFGEYNPNVGVYSVTQRVPSFFYEAQFPGIFFSIMAVLCIGMVASAFFKNGFFTILISVLYMLAALLTGTRIAILALLVGFLFILYLRISLKKIVVLSLVCMLLIPVGYAAYINIVPQQLQDRLKIVDVKSAYYFRTKLWQRSFSIFKHHPLGIGLGGINLYKAGDEVGAYFLQNFKEIPETRIATHFESAYLTILYSLGFFGALGFAGLIYISFRRGFKIIWQKSNLVAGRFCVYIVSAFIIWLIGVVTSPQLYHIQPMLIFVIFLAMFNGLYQMYLRNKAS